MKAFETCSDAGAHDTVSREAQRFFRTGAVVVLAAVGLLSTGCPGFGCLYERTAGMARIAVVQSSTRAGSCPNDPVEVLFDFTPNEASNTNLVATGERLTVTSGSDPARSWVEASGLPVGSVHPATRSDETNGACAPLGFSLDDVDYKVAADACYGK